MACHGGCHTLDILVKCMSFYTLLISPLFSNMELFGIQTCKYSLPISNPNILY